MPTWKRSFAALWVAEFLAICGFATSSPIIPLFLRELGATDQASLNWWTGIVNAAPAITMAVFAPIWGSLSDRVGKKPMLLRAMAGGTVLVGLMALATSPWHLLALRTLQGCLTGTVAAATVLAASIVPEEEAGYRLGLLQVAVFMGNFVGPMFGGAVADLAGSRITFLATSALLGTAAFVSLRFISEDFVPKPRAGSLLRSVLPDVGVLAAYPALVPLLAVCFSVQLANGTVGPILPLIILDMTGGAPGVASISGLVIGSSSLAAAVAAAAIGKVSGRLGYGRTLLGCLVGACLFSIPQSLARDPYQLLALRVCTGIFLGGTMPSVNALIAARCDRNRQGAAYGLSSSMSSGGMALGPALGASVATGFGYSAVFLATAAVLGATATAVAVGTRKASDQRPKAAAAATKTAATAAAKTAATKTAVAAADGKGDR